jgi:hypothetical protein
MKRIAITIAVSLALVASSARADDIHVALSDIIVAGANQAQRCMRVFIETNVAIGLRDRAVITKDAVRQCEPDLAELVLHFHPDTDKAALHVSLLKEANRLFDATLMGQAR